MLITKQSISAHNYLVAEGKSSTKNEFINREVIPMTGASLAHNIITATLSRLPGNQLEQKEYTVCQSDMRVFNPVTEAYFYPDVVVIKGESKLADDEFDNLLNPILLIEVLSPGTEGYDRGDKSHIYRQIPSLREYLLFSQTDASVEHWVRLDAKKWRLDEIKGLQNKINLLDGDCEIKLADVYKKIILSI